LWGSQETSLFGLFLGGTANPEGGRQPTDKAEARRAASAQAAFPSRRAREKAVPERVIGKLVWVMAILRCSLSSCCAQPVVERIREIQWGLNVVTAKGRHYNAVHISGRR